MARRSQRYRGRTWPSVAHGERQGDVYSEPHKLSNECNWLVPKPEDERLRLLRSHCCEKHLHRPPPYRQLLRESAKPGWIEFSLDRLGLQSDKAALDCAEAVSNLVHAGYRAFLDETHSNDTATITSLREQAAGTAETSMTRSRVPSLWTLPGDFRICCPRDSIR
jgi:hypothetical protein